MKTPQLKHFEQNIAQLNNCYTHYSLVWEQFSIDYEKDIHNGKKSTVEVFPNNKSASQHRILLNKLGESHDETQNLIFKGIFLLSYGYYEQYLHKLHQFAQSLDKSVTDLQQRTDMNDEEDNDKILLNKFFNRIGVGITQVFSPAEILTLDYIRLRRNRVTHAANAVQGVISDIINNKGLLLNNTWDSQLRKKRNGIDFKRKNIDLFEKYEIIDFLNIFRNLADKIDKAFILKFSEKQIVIHYLKIYLANNEKKLRMVTISGRRSKLKNYAVREYRYEISVDEYEELGI